MKNYKVLVMVSAAILCTHLQGIPSLADTVITADTAMDLQATQEMTPLDAGVTGNASYDGAIKAMPTLSNAPVLPIATDAEKGTAIKTKSPKRNVHALIIPGKIARVKYRIHHTHKSGSHTSHALKNMGMALYGESIGDAKLIMVARKDFTQSHSEVSSSVSTMSAVDILQGYKDAKDSATRLKYEKMVDSMGRGVCAGFSEAKNTKKHRMFGYTSKKPLIGMDKHGNVVCACERSSSMYPSGSKHPDAPAEVYATE